MKIKRFKYNTLQPKIGDYVICDESNITFDNKVLHKKMNYFIDNNIGLIINEDYKGFDYIVKYDNIPDSLMDQFSRFGLPNTRGFNVDEVVDFSKDKEILEARIRAKKYNI